MYTHHYFNTLFFVQIICTKIKWYTIRPIFVHLDVQKIKGA